MKKNKVFNVIMVVLIVAIIGIGIAIVGMTQGWFKKSDPNAIVVTGVTGAVQMERNGVGFSASDGTILQQDDILATKQNAKTTIEAGGNTFALNENTEVKVTRDAEGISAFEVIKGEIFAVVNDASKLENMTFQGKTLKVNGTVFSVSVQSGSAAVNCFEGKVDAAGQAVDAGKVLSTSGDQSKLADFNAGSLNEFVLNQAIAASKDRSLCFAKTDLEKVVADRAADKQAQLKALDDKAAIISKDDSGSGSTSDKTSGGSSDSGLSCTFEIRCDTILSNMENLKAGKSPYVPANGTILATSKVMFEEGETVYDVLRRVCKVADIPFEASWTPAYNSYYVEGINNLYEFDCGGESGWMYKVNGWFPNYGCSEYHLKDGDSIVWCYTCNGLGADVGGSVQ